MEGRPSLCCAAQWKLLLQGVAAKQGELDPLLPAAQRKSADAKLDAALPGSSRLPSRLFGS